MNIEATNHDKAKADLICELETVLKAACASSYSSKESVSSEITQNICNVIEAVFIHGLRDPFFLKGSRYAKYPEPNFWPFVSKYSHRSIISQINSLNQIRTEIGKARTWVRLVLNEASLEHYILLLLSETRALSQFYYEYSFLRDSEQVERMGGVLKGLSRLPINSATNSSFLNAWTPSPLILAGLVQGKAIQVGALSSSRSLTTMRESEEMGVSALDLLPNPTVLSPIRATHRIRAASLNVSDDDASSVYSHPSMVDRSERILSSTPTSDSPLAVHGQGLAPLLVSRRTKRPRRSSRSSSESQSKDSRDQSDQASNGMCSSLVEVREKQSETMDSGIESENRDHGNGSIGGGASRVGDEVASSSDVIEEGERDADAEGERGSAEIRRDAEKETDEKAVDVDAPDSGLDDRAEEMSPTEEENAHQDNEHVEVFISSESSPDVPLSSVEETMTSSISRLPDSQPIDMATPIASEQERESLGVSLHDELLSHSTLTGLSGLALPSNLPISGGNSLMSSGWAVPRASWELDSSTAGLSCSSETDSSGCAVSFGQALRSAMQQTSPSEEEDSLCLDSSHLSSDEPLSSSSRKHSDLPDDIDIRLTTIATEKGLIAQEHRCPMCRKSIGPAFGFAKYGECGVDGQYYCLDCMRPGGQYSIPARVLLSWDWTPREVSDRGRAFIDANLERTSFDLEKLNPSIYDHVSALNQVKAIRLRLRLVSMYLFTCRDSVADDFRKRIWPRDYLYNDIHLYSFMDLQNVRNGNLEKQLTGWLKYAIGHVMSCLLCRQKGFVCEVCDRRDVIYPFNTESTHRCPSCHSLVHRDCSTAACPKCARRARYETSHEANDLPFD